MEKEQQIINDISKMVIKYIKTDIEPIGNVDDYIDKISKLLFKNLHLNDQKRVKLGIKKGIEIYKQN